MLNEKGLESLLCIKPDEHAPLVLIFAERQSPRLAYTCNFLFGTALRVNHQITTNLEEFKLFTGPAIAYSSGEFQNALQIVPDGLLSESFINSIEPVFESGSGKGDGILFDLFSAIFYLISRYEEWQSYIPDSHNRFELESSNLYRSKLHLDPVIDQWVTEFRSDLKLKFSQVQWPERKFIAVSTIDVDNLYAYKYKSWWRLIGGSVRDLIRGDFKSISERAGVIFSGKNDPFDVYETISEFCFERKIPLFYFFLQKTGGSYDRTINPLSPAYKEAIQLAIKNMAAIGIHPSYDSYADEESIKNETLLLEKNAGDKIIFSRQHYLRFHIRITPKILMKAGIKADFSMGFSSGPGFRAGTSLPFRYYDFDLEKEEALLFVPFCAMDGAYSVYAKSAPELALEELLIMADKVKQHGGIFTSVFHERSFSDHLYKGYGSLYKKLYEALKS